MNPAVGVEQFTGYVVFRNAVDRIAEVLSGGHHQTERDQNDHAELVVQSEHMIVDDAALRFDERFKVAEKLIHDELGWSALDREKPATDFGHSVGERAHLLISGLP